MSTTDWLAGALIGVLALAALVAYLAAAWPEPEPCDHAWLPLDRDGHPLRLGPRRHPRRPATPTRPNRPRRPRRRRHHRRTLMAEEFDHDTRDAR